MHINLYPVQFTVSQTGELEYHGKVVTVHKEFRWLSEEQKRDVLKSLAEWVEGELDRLDN